MGTNGTKAPSLFGDDPVTCADALRMVAELFIETKALMEKTAKLHGIVSALSEAAAGVKEPAPMQVTERNPIKSVLKYFNAKHLAKLEAPAKIDGGKDSMLVKRLLNTYTEEDVFALIDRFFECDDDFLVNRSGYTVGAFSTRVASLISSARLPARAVGVTARTQGNQRQATQAADLIRQNYGGR